MYMRKPTEPVDKKIVEQKSRSIDSRSEGKNKKREEPAKGVHTESRPETLRRNFTKKNNGGLKTRTPNTSPQFEDTL